MRKVALLAVLMAGVGCSGNGQGGSAEGLVIETATATEGLTGTFTRGGLTVRFAAIRGDPNDLQADPGAPPFAVDARWSDAEGRSILLSGAEDLLPAGASDDDVDGEQRLAELEVALEASRQLAASAPAAGVAPERDALVDLASVVERAPLVRAAQGEVPYACTIAYSHELSVKYAPILWTGGWAEHSAVGLWSYKRGTNCLDTAYGYKQSCNHGRCANDSSMSTKCSWASGWRTASYPVWYAEPSTSTGTVSGACRTAYNANPVSQSGEHVCNDDSVIQVYGIKNNASYPSGQYGGTCADTSLRVKAPGC